MDADVVRVQHSRLRLCHPRPVSLRFDGHRARLVPSRSLWTPRTQRASGLLLGTALGVGQAQPCRERSRGWFTTQLLLAVEQGQKPTSIVVTSGCAGTCRSSHPCCTDKCVRLPQETAPANAAAGCTAQGRPPRRQLGRCHGRHVVECGTNHLKRHRVMAAPNDWKSSHLRKATSWVSETGGPPNSTSSKA